MAKNNIPAMVLCLLFAPHHLGYMLSADTPLFHAVSLPTLVCVRAIISFSKFHLLIYNAYSVFFMIIAQN